jgi:hypothetical protein
MIVKECGYLTLSTTGVLLNIWKIGMSESAQNAGSQILLLLILVL